MFLSFFSEYLDFFIVLLGTILVIVIGYLIFTHVRRKAFETDLNTEELTLPKPDQEPPKEVVIEHQTPVEVETPVVEVITHVAESREEDEVEDEISSNLPKPEKPVAETDALEITKSPKKKEMSDFDKMEEKLKLYTATHKLSGHKDQDEDDDDDSEPSIVVQAMAEDEEVEEQDDQTPKRYHVLYRKEDGKWYVKREGSEKTIRVLETQKEAIAFATIKAINQDTTVVVHKRDGKIRKFSL